MAVESGTRNSSLKLDAPEASGLPMLKGLGEFVVLCMSKDSTLPHEGVVRGGSSCASTAGWGAKLRRNGGC